MLRVQLTSFSLLVVFGLFTAGSSAAVAADRRAGDRPVAERVVKEFGKGTGPDAVGIIDPSEDVPITAPQALYADENGQLFILDQVNGRVLRFDPRRDQQSPTAMALPGDLEPSDLVVVRGDIMVWDGDVHPLRPTGADDAPTRGLEEFQTRAADDDFTLSAFAQMGSQRVATDTDVFDENTRALPKAAGPVRQSVVTKGRGPILAFVSLAKGKAAATIELKAQAAAPKALAKIDLRVSDRLGAIEVLDIDKQGRIFVLGENIPESGRGGASSFVARFEPSGALDGVFELPLSRNQAPTRRFVTVAPDGDVYFLRTQQASVAVVGLGFRPLRNKKVIEFATARPVVVQAPRQAAQTAPSKGQAAVSAGLAPVTAVLPLSRQRVIDTAFAFESIQWRVTQSNYGGDPDSSCTGFSRVRRPGYLHGKLGQVVRGIPYCWGCHGSLAQIKAKFDRGVLAGNWCTRNNPRSDVAGVDCSAFVSACWGLSQHFTTIAIPSIAKPLANPWDLQPGDAFNKPGSHVMLFLRFTPDRKAEVMEAATGGCNGRVCRNVYPLASLLARGYTPVRFRGLVNLPPPSAVARVAPAAKHASPQPSPAETPQAAPRRAGAGPNAPRAHAQELDRNTAASARDRTGEDARSRSRRRTY